MVPMLSQSTAALARLGLEGRHRMRNRLRVHTTPLKPAPLIRSDSNVERNFEWLAM
jgi:hypothetical protein